MSLHLLNKQLAMKEQLVFFLSVYVFIRLCCIYSITFEEPVYSVVGELKKSLIWYWLSF